MKVVGQAGLEALVGRTLDPTPWLTVTQERIDRFAHCTDDHQWIHVDPARASESPFGATVAHGYLTLSLLPHFFLQSVQIEGFRLTVNYGIDRVRFPAPVPTGSRIRAVFAFERVDPVDGGAQATLGATVEREGSVKPVCVAVILFRFYE